jgi:hypothetical protein
VYPLPAFLAVRRHAMRSECEAAVTGVRRSSPPKVRLNSGASTSMQEHDLIENSPMWKHRWRLLAITALILAPWLAAGIVALVR